MLIAALNTSLYKRNISIDLKQEPDACKLIGKTCLNENISIYHKHNNLYVVEGCAQRVT